MAGKGSQRRKGENSELVRKNWPKLPNDFVPKWKRDLEKLRGDKKWNHMN